MENNNSNRLYYKYSQYLKDKYGEKVYRLPINLPVTCPNRIKSGGCTFCSDKGTGFEALESSKGVKEQLNENKEYIRKRYKAEKYIAYFQNYTNTFMPPESFKEYINEAAQVSDIVEIAVSTRPDCIAEQYLELLNDVKMSYNISVSIELGLQTVNYHTLERINRGHGLAEFIDAALNIKKYGFDICAHVILNLPYDDMSDTIETAKVLSALKIDAVKIHSLYISKGTVLCDEYENGKIALCTKDEYLERLILFIEHISPDMVVERLFSRIPEQDCVFSNWQTSWWKLRDEFEYLMMERKSFQGCKYNYLNGAALRDGGNNFGIKK